jgi:tetratricopeptide (TPR) repeat protein
MPDYDKGMRGLVALGAVIVASFAQAADFDAQAADFDAQAARFELLGRVHSRRPLHVYLQCATTPFEVSTLTDLNGRFHFRKLLAGPYVLIVGGHQQTVEIGPSLADSKGRVNVTVELRNADRVRSIERRSLVSVGELSIPKAAWREYEDAQKALGRPDVTSAVAHLKRAVEIAPQFSGAWNHLGTIAYQSREYGEAEADFRKALEANPNALEPLVNLGGVLLNLGKPDEALEYNRRAVLKSPRDALANSQLGMDYFFSDQFDLAEKYLTIAKEIDPAHFSHPQMLLAEIHLRRNQPEAAAAELRDLLDRHPDLPNAGEIKQQIARLQAAQ